MSARFIEHPSNPTLTARFIELSKYENYIGVNEYLIPDTQRDAINLKTAKSEAHNHCKNTSCTMALNWIGLHFGKDYPVLESLSTMNEFQYNAILDVFMKPGERIQDWGPHVKCFNALFKNANLPIKACFGKYRANEGRILDSLENGFPVVLGTLITKDGHVVLFYRLVENEITVSDNYAIIDSYGEAPKYKNTAADYYMITPKEFDRYVNETCHAIWLEETK